MPWSLCYNQGVEYTKEGTAFLAVPGCVRGELRSESKKLHAIRNAVEQGKGVTYALYNDFGGQESQP